MSIVFSHPLRLALLGAVILLVGCDHATKNVAKSALEDQPPRTIVQTSLGRVLDLRYTENRDIGFNLLRWVPERARAKVLLVTGALAIVGLGIVLLRRPALDAVTAALALLLAGGAGNYTDRLTRGYVVDFIHVPCWPIFNVADIYVTAGILLFLLSRRAAAARTV
jgi:signal peptidase II